MYFVYILECQNGSYYTGITTDVARRFSEHRSNKNNKGAKYTRNNKPVGIVYTEVCKDRSAASKREWEIKQLTHVEKEQLIVVAK